MGIELPHQVTARRTPISPTSFEYTFRHSELGELGSMLFCATHSGECHVTHQLYRGIGDESSEIRRKIFEPLAKAVVAQVSAPVQS